MDAIGAAELRAFISHLQGRRRYSRHPLTPPQQSGLSGSTVNCYLRSIRAFWSWMLRERIVEDTPFSQVRVPAAPVKVITPFSNDQVSAFLESIDTDTSGGYRDYAFFLTLLDTGLRLGELTGLRLGDTRLEERTLRVQGKGGKERMVPFGKGVQRMLWHYITFVRPVPSLVRDDYLFLTADGRQLSKNRVEDRMRKYGRQVGLTGVRCSPHTLRHTAAINFLRNGGNVFSLQRLLGHSSLEMTRRYCDVADVDVQKAHATASPVDNLIRVTPSGAVARISKGNLRTAITR